MTDEYSIDIQEEKGTLNIGQKNPWCTEILITIFIGIPLTIFSGIIWIFGNGFYLVFIKPFVKQIRHDNLKWTRILTNDIFFIERSEPINMLLTRQEKDWLEEDAVYFLKTNKELNEIKGKYFSDFLCEFDNKVFVQRLVKIEKDKKIEIISELAYIDIQTGEYKPIRHFDFYYLSSVSNDSSLTIKGTDQIGSKLNLQLSRKYAR